MRKLVSSDEARPAAKPLTKPCSDCPWRRDSLPGWLGTISTDQWLEWAHGETVVLCHTVGNQQCAGMSVYRANVCKSPRDKTIQRLPADHDVCFSTPMEFKAHHSK